MTTIIDQARAKRARAEYLIGAFKQRELSNAELAEVRRLPDEIADLEARIKAANDGAALLKRLGDSGRQIPLDELGLPLIDPTKGAGGVDAGTGRLMLGKASVGETLALKAQRHVNADALGRKGLVAAGSVVTPVELDTTIVPLDRPAGSILDVLPAKIRHEPKFAYLQQSTRTNNAAVVAVGAVKPTSAYQIESVDGELEVIAHLSEAMDKYLLGDSSFLADFLRVELSYGLVAAVEAKVLADVAATTGIQSQAFATDLLTTTRSAVTKLEAVGAIGSFWTISPDDWQLFELTTLDGSGAFALGQNVPVDRAMRRLWGIPAVVTTAATAGEAKLIATDSVRLSTDGVVSLEWGSPGDQFTRNQITARCEGRFATEVLRPFGVVEVDLTSGA